MIDPASAAIVGVNGLWRAIKRRMICECLPKYEAEETQLLPKILSPPFEFEEKCESGSIPNHFTTEDTDEELVLLARQGKRDAFAQLMQRHFATCLKRARRILRNQSDAEDEVQNAFAKAFECLEQFHFDGTFSAWLCRIVQNQCLMLMREHRKREIVHVDVIPENGVGLELIDQLPDQEDDIGRQQVDNLLRREISRIPPVMRNVIVLRYFEGLAMPEVAAQLHLSLPAVKSRLMRARRELRNRLVKHCGRSGPRTLILRKARNKADRRYVH